MLECFNYLREMNAVSVIVRMLLAMVFGGLVGLDRSRKHRPAGFRTHMLVCMGAAMTMLLGQYEYTLFHTIWSDHAAAIGGNIDVSRFGAQVINGIGFLGAGTIIVTGRQKVVGLTTAAGLWASACMGLAIGAGFFEIGMIATFLILMAELVFAKVAYGIMNRTSEINLYLEYTDVACLDTVLQLFRTKKVKIQNVEITRTLKEHNKACAIFNLRLHKTYRADALLKDINMIPNVAQVEEL